MKPQQRKFVVEYKSQRRQMKQERSIWGNTNFKALAEAVEIDAPQLFDTKAVSDGPETKLEARSETAQVADIVNAETMPATLPIPTLIEERIETESELKPVFAKPAEPAALSLKHPERKRAVRRKTKAPNLTGVEVPFVPREKVDDLVALEAENRRLKALLANQLLEQNTELRKMLARFDLNGEL